MVRLEKRGQCSDNGKRVAELVAHGRQSAALAQAVARPVSTVEWWGAAEPNTTTIPLLEALRTPHVAATFLVVGTLGRKHVEQQHSSQSESLAQEGRELL